MQRILSTFIVLITLALAGCSTYTMPPFASTSDWQRQSNEVFSPMADMRIDFAGGNRFPLANLSDGDYDLHFITTQADFDNYNTECAKYIKDVVKSIPFTIDSIQLIFADQYLVMSSSMFNQCKPDYVRRADGSWMVVEANPVKSDVQPHNELWRNLIFSNSKHRIVVVDRIIKNGKHYAIAYVLQSEKKGVPCATGFQYDILNRQNIQSIGTYLEYLLGISVDAMKSTAK
ncbi:MAG: hypothetical protein IK092_00755 [Muribaculaceae bacterium]|nr:hypothetical protein [Muribaculaceae bacterium]